MRFTIKTMLLAVVATAFGVTQSQATFTTYTTQVAYLAAISNPGVDNYESLGGGVPNLFLGSAPINRTAGSYSYTASAVSGLYTAGSSSDIWLTNNDAIDAITLNNFSTGVRGIGGFFFGSNIVGDEISGQTITLTATDGSGSLSQTLTNTTHTTFFGFVSDGPITSLTVQAAQPPGFFVWPTINDLTLGQAPATNPVPAPAGLLLGLTGLPIIGLIARLRRRTIVEA